MNRRVEWAARVLAAAFLLLMVLMVLAAARGEARGCKSRVCKARVWHRHQRAIVAPYAVILARIRACESRGRYGIATGNGFFGAYQFDVRTWLSVGGRGLPSQWGRLEQDYRAALLYRRSGPGPWPVCGR